jgi:hypothetical protein
MSKYERREIISDQRAATRISYSMLSVTNEMQTKHVQKPSTSLQANMKDAREGLRSTRNSEMLAAKGRGENQRNQLGMYLAALTITSRRLMVTA